MRSQCDRRYLCLVAHLRQKERDQRRAKYAEAVRDLCLFLFDLIGDQCPDCHADE